MYKKKKKKRLLPQTGMKSFNGFTELGLHKVIDVLEYGKNLKLRMKKTNPCKQNLQLLLWKNI